MEVINQRDIVIRHIGLSIVVSVGTGIATAELIRKWSRSRIVAPDGRHALSAPTLLPAVDLPGMASTVNEPATSLRSLTSGLVPLDRLEFQSHSMSVLEPDQEADWEDTALPLSLFQRSVPPSTEDMNWFPLAQSSSALPKLLEPRPALDWFPTWHPLIIAREQYQTCHIHRLDTTERLFAILFDGQYYRFAKVAIDRKQALSIAARLEQRGKPAVIAYSEERYTVWALEPDACLEPTLHDTDGATCACVEHLVTA